MGHVITHLCELYGVQKLRTSPYHTQTNGQVEHVNQTIIRMIGKLEEDKKVQTAFYWFLPCRDLLPVSLFCIQFPGFLVPRCALLFWGIFVRGLRFETFVRVLRSSELSLNNCK